MNDVFYSVELTQGAEENLEEIHDYLAGLRGTDEADALLDQFLATIETLARFPERGGVPKELVELGLREFSQVLLAHFRVIYRARVDGVAILVISDGRRDMLTLLERRLLGRPH
jgi:toxin ParE1/3/4